MYDKLYAFVEGQVSMLEGLKCSAAIKMTIKDKVLDKHLDVLDDQADMFDIGGGKPVSLIMHDLGNEDFKPDAEMAMAFVMNLRSATALHDRAKKATMPKSGMEDFFGALMAEMTGGMALRPCEKDFSMLLNAAEAMKDHADSWLNGHEEYEELPCEIYAMIGSELAMAMAFVTSVKDILDENKELFEGDADAMKKRADALADEVEEMIDVVREALQHDSECGHCANCGDDCDCDGEGCENPDCEHRDDCDCDDDAEEGENHKCDDCEIRDWCPARMLKQMFGIEDDADEDEPDEDEE